MPAQKPIRFEHDPREKTPAQVKGMLGQKLVDGVLHYWVDAHDKADPYRFDRRFKSYWCNRARGHKHES